MNKQELIALYERVGNFVEAVKVKDVIDKLKQLDEPQKPIVPQFVADWIKYCKFTNVDLYHALEMGDLHFYNANGHDIKIKVGHSRASKVDGIVLKPALMNDIVNPLVKYKYKLINTEQQNLVNNFMGGAR